MSPSRLTPNLGVWFDRYIDIVETFHCSGKAVQMVEKDSVLWSSVLVLVWGAWGVGCDRQETPRSGNTAEEAEKTTQRSPGQPSATRSTGDGPEVLERTWQLQSEEKGDSDVTPVVGDGAVVVSNDGAVRSVGLESGEETWQTPLDNMIHDIARYGGRLYVATMERVRSGAVRYDRVYVLDPSSGEQLWSAPTDNSGTFWPMAATKRRAYIRHDGNMNVYEAKTGKRLRRLPAYEWFAVGEDVYATVKPNPQKKNVGKQVVGRSLDTGDIQWTAEFEPDMLAPVERLDETVIVSADGGGIRSVRLENGEGQWSYEPSGEGAEITQVEASEDGVFLAQRSNEVGAVLVALNAETGERRWKTEMEKPVETIRPVGGTVISVMDPFAFPTGTTHGHVRLFEAETGELRWYRRTPSLVEAAPALTDELLVYGTSGDTDITSEGRKWIDDEGVFALERPDGS